MKFRPTQAWRFTGRAGEDLPPYEQAVIYAFAQAYNIPPEALAAVRIAENGPAGNDFGIVSLPDVDTYGEECRAAAESISANIARFSAKYGRSPFVGDKLTLAFWVFMGSRYCPVGAANDPEGLNQGWPENCHTIYRASGVAPVADLPARAEA